ncbi:MAG: hypothetical protein Q4E01_07665 [Actinomycetaceae bacterium]|nr:hypothetical protein [Actinomycetaceae bacterium]
MGADRLDEQIVEFAALIADPLVDAFSTAIDQVEQDSRRYPHDKYPALRPMLMRAALRETLEIRELPEGTRLAGRPQQNCQLLIAHNDFVFRVLKENRQLFENGIPVAGRNLARRAFYRQTSFDNLLEIQNPLLQPPINLILLWDWKNILARQEGVDLRLVHPLAPGNFHGKSVPVDLSIPVVSDASFYTDLRFETDEDALDFFAAEIAKEEQDETDAG